MNNGTSADAPEIRRPIVSLISKSEKAQTKLPLGSWQHTMLRDQLKALRIALVLLDNDSSDAGFAPEGLPAALKSLASMKSKTRQAQAKFSPGTPQHTLLRNRFKALCAAELLVKTKWGELRLLRKI